MLIGMLMSAISGGMTALMFALAGGHSLAHVLVSYPLGGMIAVASFLTMCLIRQEYAQGRRF
jgi:hypothetical protein